MSDLHQSVGAVDQRRGAPPSAGGALRPQARWLIDSAKRVTNASRHPSGQSLLASARGRIPVGELGAVRPELLQCRPSYRTEQTRPRQPKHGISDTPSAMAAARLQAVTPGPPSTSARSRSSISAAFRFKNGIVQIPATRVFSTFARKRIALRVCPWRAK